MQNDIIYFAFDLLYFLTILPSDVVAVVLWLIMFVDELLMLEFSL